MTMTRISAVLVICCATLSADYVVEWSASGLSTYSTVYTASRTNDYDVDGDGIPDVIVLDDCCCEMRVYSGVTGSLIWTINLPTGYLLRKFYVGNTDRDASKELVLGMSTTTGFGRFLIYDCESHNLEYASPEKRLRIQPDCFAVADVDGDGMKEICFIGGDSLATLDVYGWSGPGIQENPSSDSRTTGAVVPSPARRSVRFSIPPSEDDEREVTITDVAGRVVRKFRAEDRRGTNTVVWDCRDNTGRTVPTGTYLYSCGNTAGKLEVVE